MAVVTSPAYIHVQCNHCDEIIDVPVYITAEKVSDSEHGTEVNIKVKLDRVDLQVTFDHQFEKHMGLFTE